MKCNKCSKTLPITKPLQPTNDTVTCVYCGEIRTVEDMTGSDDRFHFRVLGEVRALTEKIKDFPPRVLMDNQSVRILDVPKILEKSIKIIRAEPNLNAVCAEFMIADSDIRIEVLTETK